MADNAADETATFALDLQDGSSGPAEAMAKQLEGLKRAIDRDTASLGQMQKALRNLKGATTPNLTQIGELNKRIAEQKSKVASAQSSFLSLGGKFEVGKKGAKGFAERLAELGKTTQAMPGPLGGMVGSLSKLGSVLGGGAMAAGLLAVAAAVVAITVAVIAATVALLKYGIASANARRSELLRLEGLTKMRNWWGIAAGNAKEMQASIDRVSGSTALGRDKLNEYANQIYRAGLRGEQFNQALEGAAIKGAVLGDEGAKAFIGWAAGANMAGKSVKRLTDDVKARFGGVAAAQLLDLNVQTQKLHENFAALFSGLKIEALLKGVSAVLGLFSQSTKSGQALKAIMGAVFQPMVDAAAYVAPIVKRFFQGIIIGSLLVTLAVLKVRRWFREVFGSELVNRTYLMRAALVAGATVFGVILAVVAPFVLMLASLATQFYLAAAAGSFLWKWIGKGYDKIKSIEWGKLGRSIVEGIVNGIKKSAAWLIDTVSELGASALDAFKAKLGIASPSKVFAQLGVTIPQGLKVGVERGAPEAQSAVAGLVDVPRIPPVQGGRTGAPAPRASGSNTITITLGGITVQTTADKAEGIAEEIEAQLVPVFERIAHTLGARLPTVPA